MVLFTLLSLPCTSGSCQSPLPPHPPVSAHLLNSRDSWGFLMSLYQRNLLLKILESTSCLT